MRCFCFITLLLITSAGLSHGVGAPSVADSLARVDVPEHIRESGLAVFQSRAGDEFVSRFAVFDTAASMLAEHSESGDVRYRLSFRIVVPELGVDTPAVTFTVDGQGNLVSPGELTSVPDCLAHPEGCELSVSRAEAISVAKREGVPGSPDDWEMEFRWDFEYGFVWQILDERPTHEGSTGSVHVAHMTIDAGSGEVIDAMWGIKTICRF